MTVTNNNNKKMTKKSKKKEKTTKMMIIIHHHHHHHHHHHRWWMMKRWWRWRGGKSRRQHQRRRRNPKPRDEEDKLSCAEELETSGAESDIRILRKELLWDSNDISFVSSTCIIHTRAGFYSCRSGQLCAFNGEDNEREGSWETMVSADCTVVHSVTVPASPIARHGWGLTARALSTSLLKQQTHKLADRRNRVHH